MKDLLEWWAEKEAQENTPSTAIEIEVSAEPAVEEPEEDLGIETEIVLPKQPNELSAISSFLTELLMTGSDEDLEMARKVVKLLDKKLGEMYNGSGTEQET